ncbi:hypothetical protein GOODEAATRI_017665 [Goodea atripinnis]|uniref:Uncharacterized protein n=1 Tax=Goodea atripinnis TaxID=208336 RepID=A0ABV0NYU7_9TELE
MMPSAGNRTVGSSGRSQRPDNQEGKIDFHHHEISLPSAVHDKRLNTAPPTCPSLQTQTFAQTRLLCRTSPLDPFRCLDHKSDPRSETVKLVCAEVSGLTGVLSASGSSTNGLQTRTTSPFNLQICWSILTRRGRTDMVAAWKK